MREEELPSKCPKFPRSFAGPGFGLAQPFELATELLELARSTDGLGFDLVPPLELGGE